ncbi:Conjugal transfer protein [Pseudomonas syringae pv. maculicola]|uniref:Conjugal transfer protein n=1 Tax=Pseudomonas syringae pv. maculicola TaxID=59511 RepID=A0A0N0WU40_PSEYM|nr:integrating conjugative element protein [Pseudomonas syringae group genomosp. 3]KPB96780.1 Conjugal transfer protein [Pseudomonas syringae pv. maculicola]MBM0212249.1 integrating conjugative element protein [Pseudomonas syringae pv. maculicola]RMM74688.1 Conjugal transfer protein [Pseudomonas syringae pv. maculicola]RMV41192.1 Conjugal transfer protein [Pseudomonas syringae pv. maculicola]
MSRFLARSWLSPMSLLLCGLLAVTTHAHAAEGDYRLGTQGEVLDDRVMYTIGGGSAAGSPSSLYRPNGLGVGGSWQANMMCGNMSLTNTLQNQLNGVTEGFQQIMGSIVQNATQAVMSLPALIIQRANPGLYELLSNGVMQGRIDFDRSKLTCQAMAEKMADKVGQAGWGALAKNQEMQGNLEQTGGDAVAAVKNTEARNGNNGVSWVGGQKAGGSGQTPIRATSDVVRAGYNLLHNRSVDDSASISSSDCLGGAICQAWTSPQEESEWAVRVLGETEVATCDTCETLRATAGSGLTPLIQEAYGDHLKTLQGLLSGSLPPTPDNLSKASSPMLPVTRGVIEALRDDPDQELLARRLASETALSSVLDKALLLLRTLLAGSHEPNIASAEPAQTALTKNIDTLEREIRMLQTELQVRQILATNTASLVLDRHAGGADASRTVEQGDPEPGRLNDADARRR